MSGRDRRARSGFSAYTGDTVTPTELVEFTDDPAEWMTGNYGGDSPATRVML
jgi:hypothetical protein